MMFRSLCALLALLSGVAAHAAAPKPRVFCADGSPEGFDPSLWDSVGTSNVTRQIFQGLLGFARGGTALEPKLATAWAVSPDAKTFAFTLRRGVRFHATPWFTPRREFNADDVLFTFTRLIDPALPYNRAFPATFVYAQSLGLAGQIEGIDKLGDHEVRFRLKSPNVTFLSYFAMSFAGIHSAEYAAQLLTAGQASAINNRPVGTGPFKLKSYKKDDVVRMVPHQAYWRPVEQAQQLSQLIFAISREPSVRVQKLAAGECHVSAALDIAIDRNALFKVLFPRGDAMQAVSAFPPAIPGYNTALKNEYDPARAKALLAQMIQQDWARLGVRARIKTYEWGEYLKRANNGEHHVYMSGWSGDTGEADDFLAPNLSCVASRGGIKFCNAEFDRLIEQARTVTDAERRNALYREAQLIFKRERPWITMAHSSVYIPIRRDVKGFVMSPNGSVDFEGIWRE